jgi:hypothetical protein
MFYLTCSSPCYMVNPARFGLAGIHILTVDKKAEGVSCTNFFYHNFLCLESNSTLICFLELMISGTRSGTSRPDVLNKLLATTERVVQEIGESIKTIVRSKSHPLYSIIFK